MAQASDRVLKTNQVLAVAVVVLALLSFFSFSASVRQAERFERGQKFLPNLNPDEIAEITATKGDTSVHLRRDGERFVLVSAHGYPAANESVNRFLRDALGLTLEKEVGRADEALRTDLGLQADQAETTEVAFSDAAGNEMVRFLVGGGTDDAAGQYVVRTDLEDAAIYLTGERAFLSTDADSFLDKEVLNVSAERVVAVRGTDFSIGANEEGAIALADLPGGTKEGAKVADTQGALAGLRFTKQLLANDPEVVGLAFAPALEFELDDQSGYAVSVAQNGEKHYLRVEAFSTVERVEVAIDATEEEAQEKADILVRLDEIRDFNTFHGSWIYEVPSYTADKFRVRKRDLFEAS